ncbi:4-hydroxy-tetrahydrodipicolinate reductase [soil metagenome]
MLNLLVTGSNGRMGQTVISCAEADSEVEIAAAIDAGDSLDDAIPRCDAVIDFSGRGCTRELLAACTRSQKPLVMGTTGHDPDELQAIRHAAQSLPIVHAPNFSVGVNTLFYLTRRASEILGPSFDLEVVEMHHRHKVDAPSGTARRLAEILADTAGLDYAKDARHGRHGDVGARSDREIGVHSLRGGDVVGDHSVIFAADGERVELSHKASSRQTFANGAIRAAKWIKGQDPGLFDMQDVLGLK